jgi:hypothetical protein
MVPCVRRLKKWAERTVAQRLWTWALCSGEVNSYLWELIHNSFSCYLASSAGGPGLGFLVKEGRRGRCACLFPVSQAGVLSVPFTAWLDRWLELELV